MKDQHYKEYLAKLKNKESFVTKGAQTISRFKSNALVSTSFNKETELTMEDKKNKLFKLCNIRFIHRKKI